MKGFSIALLVLVALEASDRTVAFCPSNLHRPQHGALFRASSVDMATESDISIPYDAAARLAYDEWCTTYGKKFDNDRYEVFKENYEAITVMNVSAKKAARESGSENPSLLALNEYADCTPEEYEAAMSAEVTPVSTGDILGQVAEAVESQSAASNALQEAADALAEEEEKLAAQLGLDSVEELEAAIDSMDGIAPDGGAIEGDNLAREARVRSAYLDWCKEYKKEPDESRFQQFSTNFLEMEEFAKESGKEMTLNEYADCTEEEYTALLEGEAAVKEAESAIRAADVEIDTKAKADAAAATKAAEIEAKKKAEEAEAKKKVEEALAAKKAEEMKKKVEEEKKKKAVEEEKKKMLAEKARVASMSDEERRKEIEKEKSARQSAQDKEIEKERAEAAAAAIAAAKSAEAAEAARIAKQRAIAEEAAERLRTQAREWEEKQARMAPKPKSVIPPETEKKTSERETRAAPTFSLGSLFGSSDVSGKASKVVPPKPEVVPKPVAPRSTLSLSSLFDTSAPKKAKSAPMNQPAKVPVTPKKAPAPRPTLSLDFLSKPAAAPKAAPTPAVAARAPAPAPKISSRPTLGLSFLNAPAKTPAPVPKPEIQVEEKQKPIFKIDTSDPVTDAFSAFFGGKKEVVPKPTPTAQAAPPVPKTVSKPVPSPSFSFFGGSPKPAPKVLSTPSQAPAPKKAEQGFSFFNPKPAPKVEPVPVPTSAPKASPTLSLFAPKPAPKIQQSPPPSPSPKAARSFSFFSPKPAPAPEPAPAQEKPKPAFSLFGGPKLATPKPSLNVAPVPAKKLPPSRPTLSLFSSPKRSVTAATKQAKKVAPEDNIPVLSRWTQNTDGSITGLVSNSPNFRNGTKITTSPVRQGAKANSIVRTGSGSQYRLS